MAYVVTCPCGVTIRGEDEDGLVAEVQKHGSAVHNQEATREEILAMATQD